MKRAFPIFGSLLLATCNKPSKMNLPIQRTLDCPPFGNQTVTIDRQEDDPQYSLPGVSDELATVAQDEVISNWDSIWNAARQKLEHILKDYEYEKDLAELVSAPKNTLNVLIMVSEGTERYRLDVFIDIAFEMGSHVFGVEFEELEAQGATATF